MHRTRTTLRAVAGLTLLAALVTGCGDDGDNGDKDNDAGSNVPALTADQLTDVVLNADNMGPDWAGSPTEDDDTLGPGCFGQVKELTNSIDETDKYRIDYSYQGGAPYVSSSASAYPDAEKLADVFDEVADILEECDSITGTDSDGWEYDMTLTYDDEVSDDQLDDEVKVTMTGTVTAEGQSQELSQAITMYRMGPNIVQVAMSTEGGLENVASMDAYSDIARDRLLAVAAGEQPAETMAPAPA